MLGARLLTAALLAPIFIGSIYLLPLPWFGLLFAVVVSIGAWEWAGLAFAGPVVLASADSGNLTIKRWLAAALEMTTLTVLWMLPQWQPVLLVAALILWVLAFLQVLAFRPQGQTVSEGTVSEGTTSEGTAAQAAQRQRWFQGWLGMLFGLLLLAGAWCALLQIRQLPSGSNLLLGLFALVWLADAGAYFAGKAYGRRRLAPRVSPGKTWEGAAGGMGVSLLVVVAGLTWAGWMTPLWLLVLVVLIVVSVFGDLFESVLKRSAGAKDSGQLLPGHGGVLDRIDSIIAVLPFLASALLFLGLPPLDATPPS